MVADHATKILLFQTWSIEAGQQHIVDNKNVDLALLEVILIAAAGFLVVYIMQNEDMTELFVIVQFFLNHTCLIRGITDNHCTDRMVIQRNPTAFEIVNNVFHQGSNILWMSIDIPLFERALLCFQLFQNGLQFSAVFSLDSFANQFESVAVCNGAIVVILMDVVAKNILGVIPITDQRRTCQRNHNCFTVRCHQVGKE